MGGTVGKWIETNMAHMGRYVRALPTLPIIEDDPCAPFEIPVDDSSVPTSNAGGAENVVDDGTAKLVYVYSPPVRRRIVAKRTRFFVASVEPSDE